jgi:hypothetical protein
MESIKWKEGVSHHKVWETISSHFLIQIQVTVTMKSLFIVFLTSIFISVLSEKSIDELPHIYRLRNKLLDGYQRNARPVKNHKTQTNVSVSLYASVIDVDIKTMIMKTASYMRLQWVDEHLKWTPLDYGGVESIVLSNFEVWTPDLRSFDFTHRWDSGIVPVDVEVSNDGKVDWEPTTVWTSHCNIDLKDFPFDTQVCQLKFSSFSYDAQAVKLIPTSHESYFGFSGAVGGPYHENPIWEILSITDIVYYDRGIGTFSATFTLRRRNQSYIYPVILPYLSAVLFGLLSFLEPVNNKSRIVLAMTSITMNFVTLLRLVDELGYHSLSVPYGIKCCAISIIMVALGTFIPIILLLVSRLEIFLPQRLVWFLNQDYVISFFCLPGRRKPGVSELLSDDGNDSAASNTNIKTRQNGSKLVMREWMSFISFIDTLTFYTFLLVMAIYHS